ncbi:MAG: DUF1501 domain-containing protein [Saprospiraceae bacterium]|nr:DUF1501 domain-containing protein [Saprospiraceae bacterium]MBP7699430.1 DUF1501 domain-containing protein [Saprospiraceae bacterium]
MNRRKFLRLSAPLTMSPFVLNGAVVRPFFSNSLMQNLAACDGVSDRVLVLVQLKGGNDGLNTVIPINIYDTYRNLRPDIAITDTGASAYLPLDTTLPETKQVGLHPAMVGLKQMYDDGRLNVVQGVGYQTQNLSHFKSTDLWLSGGDGTSQNFNIGTGWMGRYLDYTYPDLAGNPTLQFPDPLGIQLGDSKASLGFHTGEEHAAAINLSGQDPAGFYNLVSEIGGAPIVNVPNSEYGEELLYIMDVEQSTNKYAQRITQVFNAGNNSSVNYGDPADGNNISDLGNQLKTVARLIKGGCKTKIYLVNLSGFDTHNAQIDLPDTSTGTHANLLRTLSVAVKAFHDDLAELGLDEQVISVTFSEFGRKVAQNGSFGTDHGSLAPMFIIGKQVAAGITGVNADLATATTDGQYAADQLQNDYRQVFTTLLQDWLGASNNAIQATLFDEYLTQKLPLIDGAAVVSADCYIDNATTVSTKDFYKSGNIKLSVSPNPTSSVATIKLQTTKTADALLSIYNSLGVQLFYLPIRLQSGDNQFTFGVDEFPSGNYFVHIRSLDYSIRGAEKLVVM